MSRCARTFAAFMIACVTMQPPAALKTKGAAFFTGGGIIPCSSCHVSFTLDVNGLIKSTSTFTFGCSFSSFSFAWPSASPFFDASVTVFHQFTFAPAPPAPAPAAPPPAEGGGTPPAMSTRRGGEERPITMHRDASAPLRSPERNLPQQVLRTRLPHLSSPLSKSPPFWFPSVCCFFGAPYFLAEMTWKTASKIAQIQRYMCM